MPGRLHQQPADMSVPGLGDRARSREEPDEYSEGTSPTNEPIVLPVNRSQSPISTANANAVRVLTPRRHDTLPTIGVNSLSLAMASIARTRCALRACIS